MRTISKTMIMDTVRQIEQEKREARIEPSYATFNEVVQRLRPTNIINGLLRSLEKEGLIKTGPTINGTYIKTIDNGNN